MTGSEKARKGAMTGSEKARKGAMTGGAKRSEKGGAGGADDGITSLVPAVPAGHASDREHITGLHLTQSLQLLHSYTSKCVSICSVIGLTLRGSQG